MGSAVIHELAESRNKRIKEFYWKLWYGDSAILPDIDIREVFTGPEITIDAISVEKFCTVVGNLDESFKSARNTDVKASMDFAIVTGWQVRFLFDVYRPYLLKLLCAGHHQIDLSPSSRW